MKLRSILTLATAAALLTACSAAKNSAPVVAGNGVGGSSTASPYTPSTATPYDGTAAGTTAGAGNPYGATPYTPTPSTVYTPSTPSTTVASGSAYSHPAGAYPSVDVNATFHQVAPGDTLYNIAKRYGVSQDNIRAWNNLPDDTVKLGTNLRVKPTSASGASYGNTSSATGSYRVVSGDTLYSIAKRHNMDVADLIAANRIKGNSIKPGQILKITAAKTQPQPAQAIKVAGKTRPAETAKHTREAPAKEKPRAESKKTADSKTTKSGSKNTAPVRAETKKQPAKPVPSAKKKGR